MVDTKKDDRRKFVDDETEKQYYIATATADDVRKADWQYSRTYTKCLVEGITTTAEMMDILTRRGIIGTDFEQRSEELTNNLNSNVLLLEVAKSPEEKRELAIIVQKCRNDLFQWNQRLNGPLSNTAEQISDDVRLEVLTACMVQNEDGSNLWENYDGYLEDKNQTVALKARFEVMLYLQGLESDFLSTTPEAKAIQELEDEANKVLNVVDNKKTENKKVRK